MAFIKKGRFSQNSCRTW